MTQDPAARSLNIGTRLRNERKRLGLTVSSAAAQSGLSTGFISLIENGKTDVTVGRLSRLLDAYGMQLRDFIVGSDLPGDLRTEQTETTYHSEQEGVDYQFFEPNGSVVPVFVTIARGGGWTDPSIHSFDESDHVLHGEIECVIGSRTITVSAGNSCHIPSGTPHRFRNVGESEAEFFSILQAVHPTPDV